MTYMYDGAGNLTLLITRRKDKPMAHKIEFKKVVEYERGGKRYVKVTSAQAKDVPGAVRETYEVSKGVPGFSWFIPVDAVKLPIEQQKQAG